MADIRIKDLTTTASSTASDDFIAVDGTTNGTRKLNAFSPTFGGNATVTGTLTVNGTGTNSIPNLSVTGIGGLNVSANFLTSANTLRFSDSAAGGQTWFMSPQLGDGVATNFAFYSNDGVTSTPLFRVSSAGVFRLPSTAASTSTSSGALVVGNGTSGGLGVGGNVTVGGQVDINAGTAAAPSLKLNGTNNGIYYTGSNIVRIAANATEAATFSATAATVAGTFTSAGSLTSNSTITAANTIKYVNSGVSNGTTVAPLQADIGADGTLGALLVSIGGSPSATGASRFGYVGAGDVGAWRRFIVGSNTTSGGGQVLIPATDASTSTSSGALVVSGGVGVAKRIHSGEGLTTGGDNETHISFVRNGTVSIGPDNTATPALVVSSAIKTAAPSGGTAANWKLGTVASVSPTSPNRTIEVDIGGTIYYIHAKTTNN